MIKRRFEWWQPGALRRAYKHFDTKRKNRLLPADLADGLRALKVKLSAQQEQDLFDSMDLDKDGTISYTEFIVFVRDPCHPFLGTKSTVCDASSETPTVRCGGRVAGCR